MKKIKLLLTLCLILSLIIIGTPASTTMAYAKENGIVVTHKTFGDNNTTEIVRLTNKVIKVEDGAFSGLTALKEIRVDSGNRYYASCNGCLYNKNYTVLICIPRNVASIQIKTSITSYAPHALDGLPQPLKGTLDRLIDINKSTKRSNGNTKNTNTTSVNNSKSQKNSTVKQSKKTKTDFSQYVYTNKDGEKVFKYTGSGNSRIIIPEGVQIVESFCPEHDGFNDEITYVRLPSTIETSYDVTLFYRFEYNLDTNYYDVLYQCRNLQKVEGGNYSFQCNGNSVTRPGNITVWSKDKLVPYDQQKYIDYNNRNKNKKWYK